MEGYGSAAIHREFNGRWDGVGVGGVFWRYAILIDDTHGHANNYETPINGYSYW